MHFVFHLEGGTRNLGRGGGFLLSEQKECPTLTVVLTAADTEWERSLDSISPKSTFLLVFVCCYEFLALLKKYNIYSKMAVDILINLNWFLCLEYVSCMHAAHHT